MAPASVQRGGAEGAASRVWLMFYSVFVHAMQFALLLIELAVKGCQHREDRQTIIFIVFWRCPCRKSSPNSSQSASGRPKHYIYSVWRPPVGPTT